MSKYEFKNGKPATGNQVTKPNLNSPNSLTHPSDDTFNNNQTLTERQET